MNIEGGYWGVPSFLCGPVYCIYLPYKKKFPFIFKAHCVVMQPLMDIKAKVMAHKRAGFPVSSREFMDDSTWYAFKKWRTDNPEFCFHRHEPVNGKVFYQYNKKSRAGIHFVKADTAMKYRKNRTKAMRSTKRYKAAAGLSTDVRFSRWVKRYSTYFDTRGLKNTMVHDEFKELFDCPCFYCGSFPPENKSWGIDRLQNKEHYYYDNCVPCCTICNFAKGTLGFHEFLGQIFKISEHLRPYECD